MVVFGHRLNSMIPEAFSNLFDCVILDLQSTAGAARPRDVLPVANPSPATSRRSPCTSSPAGTSCAGPAWPSARRLRPPPSTAGAARGRRPRTMSGGFTSDPRAAGRTRTSCCCAPCPHGSAGGAASPPGGEPESGEDSVLCLQSRGDGGLESGPEPEDDKSHSFFIKEYVFIQDWSPPPPRGSEV